MDTAFPLKILIRIWGLEKIIAVQSRLAKLEAPFFEADAERIHNDFINEMIDFYEYDPSVKPFMIRRKYLYN